MYTIKMCNQLGNECLMFSAQHPHFDDQFDRELEGVRDAGVRDPDIFGEALPMELRVPDGVLRPLERELCLPAGVSLPV